MRIIVVLLGATIVACSPSGEKQAVARIALGGHVRDTADMLSMAAEQSVDVELARLEANTGDQVAVVTVVGLAGQPIERFALDYARRWGLGQKHLDNGVLMLIAPKEHKVRIEVGTGLEGLLTDDRAQKIVDSMLMPFENGKFDDGVKIGVGEVSRLLMSSRKRPQPKFQPMRRAA
ncbi:MAG: TPM domain-containing protein [Sphingomicrobium sp.]